MNIDLRGKRAVISGSSVGIGYAIADGLAGAGANIVINGRDKDKLAIATAQLSNKYPSIVVQSVVADLSSTNGVASLLKLVPEADILVNNAGIYETKVFVDISDDDWQRIFDTNVMSAIRLSRHYHPQMLKSGWGRIVFISSESALNIPVDMIHYGMSKAAMLAISRGLAEASAGSNVTVNSVLPGPTRSDGVICLFSKLAAQRNISLEQLEQEFIQQHRPTSLLRRLATVQEVANMVVYVCSCQAAATNGAALRVEGGVLRSIS